MYPSHLQSFCGRADLIAAQLDGLPVRIVLFAQLLCTGDVVAVALVDDSHDGRACAGNERAERAQLLGLTHDVLTVFDQTETVRLVQTVTGCHIKVFQLAGGQAAREQRCARQIVNRIVMVDGLWQRRTRLFRWTAGNPG